MARKKKEGASIHKARTPTSGMWAALAAGLVTGCFAMRVYQASVIYGGINGQFMDNLLSVVLSFSPLIIDQTSLTFGGLAAMFGWAAWQVYAINQKKNLAGRDYGSAGWNRSDYTKDLREKDMHKNWIMTNSDIVSMNMSKTKRNRNCTIIGRPGTGKSRYWLTPNILNAGGETIIVTDPKGELLDSCGWSLVQKGYDIKVFNLKAMWRSDTYNPFDYIQKLPDEAVTVRPKPGQSYRQALDELKKNHRNIDESSVMSLINAIMENTKSATMDTTSGDPFWEKAEMLFLQALFYYIIFNYPPEEQSFKTLMELIRQAEPPADGQKSKLDEKFDIWEKEDPENIGVKQWKHFKTGQENPKMISTIIMSASTRLGPFNIRQVNDITVRDSMELDRIGKPYPLSEEVMTASGSIREKRKDGRVAYFIITNPNDASFNFLASMMYTQMFNIIDSNAKASGGSMKTPVQMYMDEFAQLGKIPRFLENWAYVRGLNVGITVIIQSLDQLKKLYKDFWETALDCCDYILFLGSESKTTLDYVSTLLGDQTLTKTSHGKSWSKNKTSSSNQDVFARRLATISELGTMRKGYGVLMMANTDPFYSKLYDMEKDPEHKNMYEPWTERKGENDPKFRQSKEWLENHARMFDIASYRAEHGSKERLEDMVAAIQNGFAQLGYEGVRIEPAGQFVSVDAKELEKWVAFEAATEAAAA